MKATFALFASLANCADVHFTLQELDGSFSTMASELVKVGDNVYINLESNPTTGYSWFDEEQQDSHGNLVEGQHSLKFESSKYFKLLKDDVVAPSEESKLIHKRIFGQHGI